MAYSLKNKVVVITGGANGIGYGIASQYLEEGARIIIILDIDEAAGDDAVNLLTSIYGKGKAVFIKCDVTRDLEAVSHHIFNKYRNIDVFVLNAGVGDPRDPKKMIDLLVTSVIEWSFKCLEYMSIENFGIGGLILINSSIFGYRTIPHAPVYQAAKFAVLGFAKSLGHAYNFAKTGVRVVALCPGFTQTKSTLPICVLEQKKTHTDQDLVQFADAHTWQNIEAVSKAAVTVYENAKSGSAWVVEGGILGELKENQQSLNQFKATSEEASN